MGDPAGIGPEVIVKGLATLPDGFQPLIVGDARCLKAAAGRWAPSLKLRVAATLREVDWQPGPVTVLDLANVPESLGPGRPSAEGGAAAFEYIRAAVDLALCQEVDAVTTAPISKEALHLAGHEYPGHTELLAELTRVSEVALMLASGDLRVVLTTTHTAVAEVPRLITRERVYQTLWVTHQWLREVAGLAHPRLAVTGLNPHCGEGGIFGREETEAILPALAQAREEGLEVSGPHSADALFGRLDRLRPDAVVTMYHDQGMIPVKMAAQGRAVNITLGLPIIRTSVDHGTAFDIAGQGVAAPESFVEALLMAARLARSRMAAT